MKDAQAMFDCYASDPIATQFLTFVPYTKAEAIKDWIQLTLEQWKTHPGICYLVFSKKHPESLIGSCSYRLDGHKADVGYVIGRAFWNQGYATEILKYWVDWSMSQDSIYRVSAYCDVDNTASARVMQKAGMHEEGRLRKYAQHPNTGDIPRDVFYYSKVK